MFSNGSVKTLIISSLSEIETLFENEKIGDRDSWIEICTLNAAYKIVEDVLNKKMEMIDENSNTDKR